MAKMNPTNDPDPSLPTGFIDQIDLSAETSAVEQVNRTTIIRFASGCSGREIPTDGIVGGSYRRYLKS